MLYWPNCLWALFSIIWYELILICVLGLNIFLFSLGRNSNAFNYWEAIFIKKLFRLSYISTLLQNFYKMITMGLEPPLFLLFSLLSSLLCSELSPLLPLSFFIFFLGPCGLVGLSGCVGLGKYIFLGYNTNDLFWENNVIQIICRVRMLNHMRDDWWTPHKRTYKFCKLICVVRDNIIA